MEHKALHLTLLDELRQKFDPYEASVPASVHEEQMPALLGSQIFQMQWDHWSERPEGNLHQYRQEDPFVRMERLRRGLLRIAHVCCWRWGEESEAMWRLYCDGNDGVAVRTSFAKLRDSVTDPHTCVSTVHYFNYKTGRMFRHAHNWDPALHKRIAFKHEQEVRLLRYDPDDWNRAVADPAYTAGAHVELPWDAASVIEHIVVHPQSPLAYCDTVRSAVARLVPALADKVIRSEIVTEPIRY